ncbi:PLP-dependent cysteine synthase family protein [Maribellus sediminis]|uniref:PLP-dependent cysteine synthase family protein n=1 Tax=Maribellus sediminis TaxID=2696285 RepID=UPI001430C909|nr:cysteine synthase family protein [Maribellus sediminis]
MNEHSTCISGLSGLIGNTPVLAIDLLYKGEALTVYAKAENLNMTGSIKDRMALHILNRAIENGVLKPGMPIIEATSGNTGISFAAIGRALGHKVTIFMPNWMSSERINLIKGYGAEIILVSPEEGGFTGSIKMADELAEQVNGFRPQQFSNHDNIDAHYATTGSELWYQLQSRAIKMDAFVAGVGTGGTVMGVGKYLREQDASIKIHPLEPSNSPTLSTGYKIGKHRIQGISDEFIPSIVDLDFLDKVVEVDDGDSIIMAQKLARIGIGVGISSGANLLGAIKVASELGKGAVVGTVFADDNKKYLSTGLLMDEPIKEGFLSSDVQLLGFKSFNRICQTSRVPEICEEMLMVE